MKIITMLLVSMLCLSTTAFAIPDSIKISSYKISFDLGLPKNAYTIKIDLPKTNGSISGNKSNAYSATITNKTGRRAAIITIKEFEKEIPILSADAFEKLIKAIMNDFINVKTVSRSIDNSNGSIGLGVLIVSSVPIQSYLAVYQPAFNASHLMVFIESSYPWDEGTSQLLKTIHIEKIYS